MTHRARRMRTATGSRRGPAAVLVAATLILALAAHVSAAPRDTTLVRMVEVAPGVSLETLDWGGEGDPILLLAGLGNTAHVYEDFARLLARGHRVYGLTRRGYGASTHAHNGYAPPQLAGDVKAVCDSLGLDRPVLIGHSLAGGEMAWFASRWPGRARGFVFLDAAYDHGRMRDMEDMAPRPALPPPRAHEVRSLRSVQEWLLRTRGFAVPPAELRALYVFDAEGRPVDSASSPVAQGLMLDALTTPPYARVDAPALAIFVKPTLDSLCPGWEGYDAENKARVGPRASLSRQLMSAALASFEKACPQASVMVMEGVNHHLFLTETAAVLAAVQAFLNTLPPPEAP